MVNHKKGWHHSEETKRKISEAQLGEKSNNWEGGTYYTKPAIRERRLNEDIINR